MEHGFPLARLAQLIADIRARRRTVRVVARNTERFGLVHLYFERGRLAQVHGHAAAPLASITDLATWRYGVLRQDAIAEPSGGAIPDPQLDAALDDALFRLQASGVVRPSPMPLGGPSSPPASWPSPPGASHASPPPPHPPSIGSGALPPRARDAVSFSPSASPTTRAVRADAMTTPQWQLIALVVHQVVEGAGALIGAQMAQNLLRQASAHTARSHPILLDLEVDAGGWLKAREDGIITSYSTYDVADAVAAVLTSFEVRCASLVGAERAKDIMLVASAPFRNALTQIGLDISP